jgi:hypothetical protein
VTLSEKKKKWICLMAVSKIKEARDEKQETKESQIKRTKLWFLSLGSWFLVLKKQSRSSAG